LIVASVEELGKRPYPAAKVFMEPRMGQIDFQQQQ
jgi:hypothetical protein